MERKSLGSQGALQDLLQLKRHGQLLRSKFPSLGGRPWCWCCSPCLAEIVCVGLHPRESSGE